MSKAKPARAEVDITPTWPTPTDPYPPWPYTRPDPRPSPYSKPGTPLRIMILPGLIEYDPAMNEVEQRIRKLASKYHVTVVVPDVYRGVGEIMARRNGLNYLIVNTDLKDAVNLPSSLDRSVLERSSVARRRCLMECDRLFYVTNCPSAKSFLDEIPKWSRLSNIKLTSFKAFYVKVKKETKRNSTQCESKTKRKSKK